MFLFVVPSWPTEIKEWWIIQISFTEEDRAALHRERFHHPDPRVQLKAEVLWLKSHGLDRPLIARLAGISTRTVQRYLNAYLQGGLERLKENRDAGKTSDLEPWTQSLRAYFEQHPPASVKEAQHVLQKQTGVRREETQVRRFLHRLGLRCRRMGTVPGKLTEQQQGEQRRFLDEDLNPRLDAAQAGLRQLFFVDASHFVHGAFVCSLWCFVRLFVRSPSGRKRFNVLGAVDFATKQLVTVTNTTYVTATTVCELLRLLAAQRIGLPITLVLDNARYQKCALVQNLASALGIELLYLPAYSPNLNLIERLWKHAKKRCLNGKYYQTFAEFQAAITTCLARINTDDHQAMTTLLTRNFQLFDNRTFLAA